MKALKKCERTMDGIGAEIVVRLRLGLAVVGLCGLERALERLFHLGDRLALLLRQQDQRRRTFRVHFQRFVRRVNPRVAVPLSPRHLHDCNARRCTNGGMSLNKLIVL
jgi:hypothetical protein